MKAVIYIEYGPPSVLQLTDIVKPIPKPKEVLVRVYASSVTAGAIWVRQGIFPGLRFFTALLRLTNGLFKPRRPVLGFEFSGVVEAIGEAVTQFRPGDAVYGTTTGLRQGAYAEYVCVPQSWSQGVMALKPAELSFTDAAVLPIGGMTALQLLRKADIQKGQRVLIYGASGSVGTYAVQLAAYLGGNVTAACRAVNFELVQSIGANTVIDYTKWDMTQWGGQFDVVFDAVGKLPAPAANRLLTKGGQLLSITSITQEKVDYLHTLHGIIAEGRLKPIIDRTYGLDDIVNAHTYVDLGHKRGNVVVQHSIYSPSHDDK